MSLFLVEAALEISFSEANVDRYEYDREYIQLSDGENDPINQWLKIARSKRDTVDTDPILLSLIVELHKKIDSLERLIKNEQIKRVELTNNNEPIDSIGFEHFKLKNPVLSEGVEYYGRIELPVHPKREIGIFFKTQDSSLAKIVRIHEKDERDWSLYLTARERAIIRMAKEAKE